MKTMKKQWLKRREMSMKVELIQTAILPGIEFKAWLQLVYGGNINDIMCKRHLCPAANAGS